MELYKNIYVPIDEASKLDDFGAAQLLEWAGINVTSRE
jgi:hypothetical protein